MQGGCELARPPERQHVDGFPFLTLLGAPKGSGFLVEAHQIDGRRNYSVASTRHPGIDDATEGELACARLPLHEPRSSVDRGFMRPLAEEVRFASDSPLEEAGFEPLVPR
jgi:hypothetical protein